MKKLINIALVAFVSLFTVSCYNNQGIPEPAHVYTAEDFSDSDVITIKELKATYAHLAGSSTAMYVTPEGNTSEVIKDDLVISGKVISSDEEGNVYKSLYIQEGNFEDGSRAAIELRLFASNYTKYPVGTTIFVKLKGLSIGDYRGMLSIGAHSMTATDPSYVHTTIEGRNMLKEHIFIGESGELTDDDYITVNKDNYTELFTSLTDNYLACLVRFEGLTSALTEYGAAKWTNYAYPSYFAENTPNGMFDWSEELAASDSSWKNPTVAYKGTNPVTGAAKQYYYYGSSWYTFDRNSDSSAAQFIARISGYARFKGVEIPADGKEVNINAILTVYLSKSGFYQTFQIVPRFKTDLEF